MINIKKADAWGFIKKTSTVSDLKNCHNFVVNFMLSHVLIDILMTKMVMA